MNQINSLADLRVGNIVQKVTAGERVYQITHVGSDEFTMIRIGLWINGRFSWMEKRQKPITRRHPYYLVHAGKPMLEAITEQQYGDDPMGDFHGRNV